MREIVVELVELHPLIWFVIMACLWINYGRSVIPALSFADGRTATLALFVMSCVVFLLLLGVTLKCWHTYRRLLKYEKIFLIQKFSVLIQVYLLN